MSEVEGTNPTTPNRWEFLPEQLDRTVIAIPLLNDLKAEDEGVKTPEVHAVVMEINLEHELSRDETRVQAKQIINAAKHRDDEVLKPSQSRQYLYARLWGDTIRDIVERNEAADRPIYRIWPDFEIGPL